MRELFDAIVERMQQISSPPPLTGTGPTLRWDEGLSIRREERVRPRGETESRTPRSTGRALWTASGGEEGALGPGLLLSLACDALAK